MPTTAREESERIYEAYLAAAKKREDAKEKLAARVRARTMSEKQIKNSERHIEHLHQEANDVYDKIRGAVYRAHEEEYEEKQEAERARVAKAQATKKANEAAAEAKKAANTLTEEEKEARRAAQAARKAERKAEEASRGRRVTRSMTRTTNTGGRRRRTRRRHR